MSKSKIVAVDYGMTVSKEGNACLYLDITKKNGKTIRFLGKGAINMAERIFISHKMKEMWEMKKVSDQLYLSKHK